MFRIGTWLSGSPDLEEGLACAVTRLQAEMIHALARGDVYRAMQVRFRLDRLLQEGDQAREICARAGEFLHRGKPQLPQELPTPPSQGVLTYCISSAKLAKAYARLTQRLTAGGLAQDAEWMLLVTGIRLGENHILEHLIEAKLAYQSAGGASLDMSDFDRVTRTLDEHGQALYAVFHSHPTRGAPQPSGIDRNLQRVLEQGYPAIQAVFSRDGYVRFFANQRRFAIQVYGQGVKREQDDLFRIIRFGTLPDSATETQ